MNVKQLIEAVIELPVDCSGSRPKIDKLTTLELIKLLDEPQKVKVSEEEAKFLETFDFGRDSDITKALYYVSRAGWGHQITDNNNVEMEDLTEDVVFFVKNRKKLIKAILDGYEVEKEKRYLVKVKGFNDYSCYLNKGSLSKEYFLESKAETSGCRTKHTRKQLEEDGFGWVFDCEGIEIEEVE